MFKSESRNPLAVVTGDYSTAIYGEILIYFILANTILWIALKCSLKFFNPSILMILPVYFVITTLWSTTTLLTLVRSLQLMILLLLIDIIIEIYHQLFIDLLQLYKTFNRFIITSNTLLVIYAFIQPTFSSGGRLTYFNVHPIVSATATGLVSILLMTMSLSKQYTIYRIIILILNFSFMFLNMSRGPLIALIVVAMLVIFTTNILFDFGKLQILNIIVILTIYVSTYALLSLQNYFGRGEELETLNQLNGRIFLWSHLTSDNSVFQTIFGHGYGSERVAAFDAASWAGSSHNSWISFFYGGGIVILLIFVSIFLHTFHYGWKCRVKIPAIFPIIFLTICSLTGDTFQFPNIITFGYFLYLTIILKIRNKKKLS